MIRNILFTVVFFLGIIFISIIFLPSLIMPPAVTLMGGKIMGYWAKYCLRIFLSVKINIIGRENIVDDEKFFIACSHQSMFETFFLQTIFNSPIFILKKELLKIPIFGLYLKKIGSISINRNKTTKENLGFFDKILKIVNNSKRPLLIFPQGTRVLSEDRPKFKKGTGRIYEALKIKCQPVALNSGYVWPKNKQLSNNKTITVSILKPISPGLDKEKFINLLQNNIYSELDKMN
ncbi:MAG: 1-acyl-sn-glycerol-3-phosphate acyltransferase [Pelagibacterales bacterium]|nr:1-acyl-sn-glycerol-3-phosphate acyltransferase [Pelagibacterales bacterium]